ncbi:hypothetical protein E4U42_007862, partial [Claviceps africana]
RDGVLVAEETRVRRHDARALPRLTILAVLAERDLDLLVACWVARVYKEAEGTAQGWKEFTRFIPKIPTSSGLTTAAMRGPAPGSCVC